MIDEPLYAWRVTPAHSKTTRVMLAALVSVGLLMTGFGSIFLQNTPPIPYKLIPDLRAFGLIVTGLLLGFSAATGGASRRKWALWGVTGFVIAFHLEEATVHWIGPYPGSITGTRVGLLGTAGSLLALVSILLLHVENESERLRRDVLARGASAANARTLAQGLARHGRARIVAAAMGVSGLAVLVRAGEAAFGNEASGGAWVLFAGGTLLLVLATFILRLLGKKRTP